MIVLKVIDPNGLQDMVTNALLKEGDVIKTDDLNRINNLVSRNLCEIVSIALDADPKQDVVSFNDREYGVEVVRDSLNAIGLTVAKNIGCKGLDKKLAELSDEQKQQLIEELDKQ